MSDSKACEGGFDIVEPAFHVFKWFSDRRMRRMRSKYGFGRGFLAIAAFVLAFGFSANLAAQEDGSEILSFTTIRVQPTKYMLFRNMIKDEFLPAWKKGGGKSMTVWQTRAGEGFEFIIVESMENFAAMDGPSPLDKGLGEGAANFYSRVSAMIDGFRVHMIRTKPAMSYLSEKAGPPNVGVYIRVTVNPDKEQEFEKFVAEDYLPVVKKAGADGFWASKVIFGGSTNVYSFLAPHKNFAELDKGDPVRRALSNDEAMRFAEKIPKGTILGLEVDLMSYQADLSVPAKRDQ